MHTRIHSSRAESDQLCRSASRLAGADFGVSADALLTQDRHRAIADARAVAQAAVRDHGLTLVTIAEHYGQHYSTVIYALAKVAKTPHLRAAADRVAAALTGRGAAQPIDQVAS